MSVAGGAAGAGAGGGCGARALRLLLLAVLALAALQYMFGSALDAGGLRSLVAHKHAASSQTEQKHTLWPKRLRSRPQPSDNPEDAHSQQEATSPGNRSLPIQATAPSLPNNSNHIQIARSDLNSINLSVEINKTSTSDTNSDSEFKIVRDISNNKGISEVVNDNEIDKKNSTSEAKLKPCLSNSSELGPTEVDTSVTQVRKLKDSFPWVRPGGLYAPTYCAPKHKVAIVVPFRDRDEHLAIFLNHMHSFLNKQEIDYGIFIVQQAGTKPFNRAKLMNVGFVEGQRSRAGEGGWHCFVFHDVDLLPLDSRNLYTCPRQPRHMSAAVDKFNFALPYNNIFGGVSAMTVNQFLNVNGFSNKYWGWGGEDDDMFHRLRQNNYHISRYPMSIARYMMLHHKPQTVVNTKRYTLLMQTQRVFKQDGLSSLRYRVLSVTQEPLYTAILADIDEES